MEKNRMQRNLLHKRFRNDLISKALKQVYDRKLDRLSSKDSSLDDKDFIDSVVKKLGIELQFSESEIERLPKKGAFILVANHPFSGLDGIFLLDILAKHFPDLKVAGEPGLYNLAVLKDKIIKGEIQSAKEEDLSPSTQKLIGEHLQADKPLIIFPAADTLGLVRDDGDVSDNQWINQKLNLIKNAGVPIIPVYIKGNNNRMENLLERIHPLLGNTLLRPGITRLKKRIISLRIGNPISPRDQRDFEDIEQFGRYLRMRIYALGTQIEINKFFMQRFRQRIKRVEEIVAPVAPELLKTEIDKIRAEFELFSSSNFSVLCAPATCIPNILNEIGRLREITFREVGEGTNRSIDLDEYDLYYQQLIIWDNQQHKIVGAYRVGKGRDILAQYGPKGFYIQSLFRIKKNFYPVMKESLELGRSFVVKEYQRKPLSLFLLWKGILYFLIKHPEYRYLIGPVSISNQFTKFSKSLIVNFIQSGYYHAEFAQYIKPRKRFRVPRKYNFDKEFFIKNTDNDFKKLDKIIRDIEPYLTTPVLLKKYIQLNAKIIGFNIDPKFNDALDGLIILDIFEVPSDILESLSKEINDSSIMERFNTNTTNQA